MWNALKGLIRPVLKVGSLEAMIQAVVFAAAIVKFRYFRAELMGVLAYFLALSEIPALCYGSFNRLLTRFAPAADENRRAELFLATAVFQVGLLAAFVALGVLLFASVPAARFWEGKTLHQGADFGFIPVFLAALVAINLIQNLLAAFLNSLQQFLAYQWIHLALLSANAAAALGIVLAVPDRRQGMLALLWTQTAIAGLGCCAFAAAIRARSPVFSLSAKFLPRARKVCAEVYRTHIRGYVLPLQLTGVFAYLKENIAVIFMGQAGLMADSGLYHMASKIYSVPQKFVPGLVQVLMPRMVVAAESDPAGFRKKYDLFSWAQFGGYLLTGAVIFAALPWIGRILGVPDTQSLVFVFSLFSLNLIVSSIAQANLNIILLGKDTRWFLLTSLVRSAVVTGATALLIPAYKSAGASLALVLSSFIAALMLAFETRKSELLTPRHNTLQLGCCVAIALGLVLPVFHWAGGNPFR